MQVLLLVVVLVTVRLAVAHPNPNTNPKPKPNPNPNPNPRPHLCVGEEHEEMIWLMTLTLSLTSPSPTSASAKSMREMIWLMTGSSSLAGTRSASRTARSDPAPARQQGSEPPACARCRTTARSSPEARVSARARSRCRLPEPRSASHDLPLRPSRAASLAFNMARRPIPPASPRAPCTPSWYLVRDCWRARGATRRRLPAPRRSWSCRPPPRLRARAPGGALETSWRARGRRLEGR